MTTGTDDTPNTGHPPPRRRRHPALAMLAGLLVVLVAVVESLILGSSVTLERETERFERDVAVMINLENAQRETLVLSRETTRYFDREIDLGELQVQRALLENQLRLTEVPLGAAALQHVRRNLAAFDDALAAGAPGRAVTARLARLEIAIKELYDDQENNFLRSFRSALDTRSASRQWLAALSGVMLVAGGAAFLVFRRAVADDVARAEGALDASEARYRSVVDSVKDVIFQLDAEGRWTFLNPAWTRLTGFGAGRSLGRPMLDFVHPEDRDGAEAQLDALGADHEDATEELRFLNGDGGSRWFEMWLRAEPEGAGFSGTLTDVTDRRVAEQRLEELALTDPLTGLANRRLLARHLGAALARAERGDSGVAVLFLDLDRFKVVNDSMGHDVGDDLLVEVASRLGAVCRRGDLVGRLGGDEFVVLCEGLPRDPVAAEREVTALADRLERALSVPYWLLDREVFVTASIGIALARHGQQPDELLADSDTAMYRAKERGRARHELFDDVMRTRVERRARLEPELHRAVANGELVAHYQPIVDVASRQVVGAEALVRWEHPTRGLLAPSEFLDVAMESDVIRAIGAQVFQQAAFDLGRWHRGSSDGRLCVAVNLSAGEIDPGLPGRLRDMLAVHGVDPAALCVEITEHHLLEAAGATVETLRALHELGVRLAMDDFGTGYSSLSHLRRLPIDIVKIDRSFVAGLEHSSDDRSIVSAIVGLGRELGLVTIAEGVETPAQARMLAEMGCDRLQGYLLGEPQEAATFDRVVAALRSPAPLAATSVP